MTRLHGNDIVDKQKIQNPIQKKDICPEEDRDQDTGI